MGGLAGVNPASAAVDGSEFRGEDVDVDLRWRSCFQEFGDRFECATARVPLDYDRPNGGKIPIDLVRLNATGENPRGSIFLNPGGPGGSGIEFVLFAGPALYGPDVQAEYNLIGFDPRGINLSNPLLCFGTLNAAFAAFPPFAFPTTDAEVTQLRRSNGFLQTQCRNRGGIIKNKMSSANVARDMEVLRAAVGDDELHFAGYSYGSVLGQVYAGLFPDRVGHIIIDGVIDIEDWVGPTDRRSTTTLGERLRSDIGAEDSFDEFLRLCEEAGPENCALAPFSAERAQAILDGLQEQPLILTDPETGEILFFLTYADLVGTLLGALYQPADWPFLALFLSDIEFFQSFQTPPAGMSLQAQEDRIRLSAGLEVRRPNPPYPNFVEGFPGVTCVDTSNPARFNAWAEAVDRISVESPIFGPLWTWSEAVCNRWPGRDTDRFVGPFGPDTANPVLVLSTRFDPATSYQQAQSAQAALPNSALVTVEGWGHTTLFTSACADAVVAAYFLDDVVPAADPFCPPDVVPFAPIAGFEAQVEGRTVLLREANRLATQ
ncbi:MAG: alpha/beta hydrolase [Actinomycetota bacterium]